MGVELYLDVDFFKVGKEEWESVFDETLELIDKYPFMDKIVDKNSYSETWIYSVRTEERYLKPWFPEAMGWHTIGDTKTLQKAGSFYLFKDSSLYNSCLKQKKTGDIYFSWYTKAHTDNEQLYAVPTNSERVFANKTQGADYHKYLLGIAALVEDRLKPNAMVAGDISRAQLLSSVEWVNKHLDRKISLPDRCFYTKLCSRLEKDLSSETAILNGLFDLLLYPLNQDFVNFVRDRFSRKTIVDYWKMEVKRGDNYSYAEYCLTATEKETAAESFGKNKNDIETDSQTVPLETLVKIFVRDILSSDREVHSEQWDITEPGEINNWKDGSSIHPNIEESIQRLLTSVNSSIPRLKRKFTGGTSQNKMEILIQNNRHILVNKKIWDFILKNIHDDTIFYQFLSLLCVDPDAGPEATMLDAVLNNLDFLKCRLFYVPVESK